MVYKLFYYIKNNENFLCKLSFLYTIFYIGLTTQLKALLVNLDISNEIFLNECGRIA
jgi:hypothetical protein